MSNKAANWLISAKYDLKTAEHMLATRRHIYTVFMCHLAIEKILKARVQSATSRIPPKTHNLRYLLELSNTRLPDDMLEFVSMLSDVSIVTRYPEDFKKLLKVYTRKVASGYLKTTKKVFKWIEKQYQV